MWLVMLLGLALMAGSAMASDAPQESTDKTEGSAPPEPPAAPDYSALNEQLREQWGIEVVALRLTAGKQMLDFRYRIVDAEKALPITKEEKPYLVDNATGQKLPVPVTPKVGALRSSGQQPVNGRIYFMIFANPSGWVKAGGSVTVVIGETTIEGLVVQ